ncbi:MAG TPA: N-methyl-L-tryptophan oxidase [Chitinophagaceae bacterium]|nr:N-methyl-L-tryptophan oxidase [Chitinophagaceae bacterium]
MNTSFDVIVIGVGSMGSSASYHLAARGYKVLGLEQFDITHELGSHAGQSRIIRKAYFEHPDYVPLLTRAYEGWKDFEEETGTQLYYRTGLLYSGKSGNEIIRGVKQSASLYNIPVENINFPEKRFTQFKIPADYETLFEPDAGFVTPERAIRLYAQQAVKKAAKIHISEKVIEWKKEGPGIKVVTDKNKYNCSKLIITAGAWSAKLIPALTGKIKVTRQFVAWVKPKHPDEFKLGKFPCWMIADDIRPGAYYGFPVLPCDTFGEPAGLKLAYHYPGIVTEPDKVNRQTISEDIEDLKYALQKYLPGTFDSFISTKICLYANSPDENFIIDKLPGEENIVIACGFSGHGFKFIPVVGEILADLAIEGKTQQPINFLRAERFF